MPQATVYEITILFAACMRRRLWRTLIDEPIWESSPRESKYAKADGAIETSAVMYTVFGAIGMLEVRPSIAATITAKHEPVIVCPRLPRLPLASRQELTRSNPAWQKRWVTMCCDIGRHFTDLGPKEPTNPLIKPFIYKKHN